MVSSNHDTMRPTAELYGLPYFEIPVTAATKAEAESKQMQIVRDFRADVVVLARYMQVLSSRLLDGLGVPVINIHHSFLPAFRPREAVSPGASPRRETHRSHRPLRDAGAR